MSLFRRDVLERAEGLAAKGKLKSAIKLYQGHLAGSPVDASTMNRLGDVLVRNGDQSDAIVCLRQAAQLYFDQGFYAKAVAIYKKILRIVPDRVDIEERLAGVFQIQGLASGAVRHYSRVAEHHDRRGDSPAALAVYGKLVELEPQSAAHRLRVADLQAKMGRVCEATSGYETIAEAMLAQGHVEVALRVYQDAVRANPGDLGFLAKFAAKLAAAGAGSAARRLLESAVVDDDRVTALARQLGLGDGHLGAHAGDAELLGPSVSPSGGFNFGPMPEGLGLELGSSAAVLGATAMAAESDAGAAGGTARGRCSGAQAQRSPDLVAEAAVYLKYDLRELAIRRLTQALEDDPERAEALGLLIPLLHEAGAHDELERRIAQLAAIENGEREWVWPVVSRYLEATGFVALGETTPDPHRGLRLAPPPAVASAEPASGRPVAVHQGADR